MPSEPDLRTPLPLPAKLTTLDEIDPHLRGIHYQQHNVQLTTLTGPYSRHHYLKLLDLNFTVRFENISQHLPCGNATKEVSCP